MIYNFSVNYQNLNQFSYSKDSYNAETISLYLDEIYQGEIAIFINSDSDYELEYIILNSKSIFLSELKALNMKGNPIAFSTYICRCNNCSSILIDKNPQIDAIKYDIYIDANKEFVLEDGITNVLEMEYLKDPNSTTEDEHFWACPKCKTDDYLFDL